MDAPIPLDAPVTTATLFFSLLIPVQMAEMPVKTHVFRGTRGLGTIRITFMKALLESLKPGDKDRELALCLDPARLPRHIAIIMDGNGRWARKRNLPRIAGHKAGMDPVRSTIETCARLGIQ